MSAPNGVPEAESPANGRGALVAIVVLVAVLAIAWFAYSMLTAPSGVGEPDVTTSVAQDEADLPKLADYDSIVYTPDGDTITLTNIASGKPLVMNFWATWCPYCIDEMDDFQALYDEYGDRVAFAFVDATDGNRETVEDALGWMADNGHDLPVYLDVRREAVADYGVTAFPTTVVVSKTGAILVIQPGRIDPDMMRSAIESVL
ncbi:MAG: TlpA disulfide reductase family protein [Coriobacteriia bacterium]|nr:TlpA disulfide reductase family protein [Coriobacteriia bacterium]